MKLVTVALKAEGLLPLKVTAEGTTLGDVTQAVEEHLEATTTVPAGLLIRITMRQVHRMAAVAARTARDIRDDVQERMLSVPEQAATALNCSAQFLNCSVQLQLEH